MTNILLFEKSTNIVILTLNNPAKLNPLSEEMLYQLTKKFEEIGNDKNIKAVILKSTGKAFCAGHDLKQMQLNRNGKDGGKEYFQLLFNKTLDYSGRKKSWIVLSFISFIESISCLSKVDLTKLYFINNIPMDVPINFCHNILICIIQFV